MTTPQIPESDAHARWRSRRGCMSLGSSNPRNKHGGWAGGAACCCCVSFPVLEEVSGGARLSGKPSAERSRCRWRWQRDDRWWWCRPRCCPWRGLLLSVASEPSASLMHSMRRFQDSSRHGSASPTDPTLACTAGVVRSEAPLSFGQQRERTRRCSCCSRPAGPMAVAGAVPAPAPVAVAGRSPSMCCGALDGQNGMGFQASNVREEREMGE